MQQRKCVIYQITWIKNRTSNAPNIWTKIVCPVSSGCICFFLILNQMGPVWIIAFTVPSRLRAKKRKRKDTWRKRSWNRRNDRAVLGETSFIVVRARVVRPIFFSLSLWRSFSSAFPEIRAFLSKNQGPKAVYKETLIQQPTITFLQSYFLILRLNNKMNFVRIVVSQSDFLNLTTKTYISTV